MRNTANKFKAEDRRQVMIEAYRLIKASSFKMSMKKAIRKAALVIKNAKRAIENATLIAKATIKETEKAILATVKVMKRFNSAVVELDMWIPKSTITGRKIAQWFCEKQGIYSIEF